MVYGQIPTRTSEDVNAASDVNGLQDNFDAVKGGVLADPPGQTLEELRVGTSLNDFKIGDGADTDKDITAQNADANKPKLRYNKTTNKWQYSNDGTTFLDIGSGGGAKPDQVITRVAGSFDYPAATPAPLNSDGSNVLIKEQLADDTTNESIIGQDVICNDLDAGGDVTIEVWSKAKTTPGTSKNVVHDLKSRGIGDTENFNQSLVSHTSGAKAIGTVSGGVYYHSWTVSVATMAIAANDFFPFELEHDAVDGANNLVGDLGYVALRIRIPRA